MPEFLWAVDESRARKALLAPLVLAEGLYRAGAWAHRAIYERGLRPRVRLDAKVISVGNLAAGGSAKTPIVGWLARSLRARGRKVAILSRGVRGRRGRDVNVVSDGQRMLLGPAEAGDEPVLLASMAPGVPVLAGVNRVALGLRASAVFGVEAVIVDDGFQHHRLERDLDLVCVDARLGMGNGHVLPRGPLREPASSLLRADAILWTRVGSAEEPLPDLPAGCAALPQLRIAIAPRALRWLGSARASEPVERLRGRRVGLLAAIARPDRFEAVLREHGAEVVARRVFADHHPYSRRDLVALDPALEWVTTAKDAVKIPADWVVGRSVWSLEEEVRPEDPARLLEFVLACVDAGTHG